MKEVSLRGVLLVLLDTGEQGPVLLRRKTICMNGNQSASEHGRIMARGSSPETNPH